MTAGLCRCSPDVVRAVSPDRCACGGALYREAIAPEPRSAADAAQDASAAPLGMPEPAWAPLPPTQPGEVWRFDDGSGAVTLAGDVAQAWYWQPASDGSRAWTEARGMVGGVVLAAWAMAERARADRAEAALAAFQRYAGHADAVSLAVAVKAAERRGDA